MGVPPDLKNNTAAYPYGQLPRYVDDDVDIVQSLSILRHIARKYDLYGTPYDDEEDEDEAAEIDSLIDALEDLHTRTNVLVHNKFSDAAMAAYQAANLAPRAVGGSTAMAAIERLVSARTTTTVDTTAGKERRVSQDYFVASGISIADIVLMNTVDIHLSLFPIAMRAFPTLLALHARISAEPAIAEYLSSSRRPAQFWGSEWLASRAGRGWGT